MVHQESQKHPTLQVLENTKQRGGFLGLPRNQGPCPEVMCEQPLWGSQSGALRSSEAAPARPAGSGQRRCSAAAGLPTAAGGAGGEALQGHGATDIMATGGMERLSQSQQGQGGQAGEEEEEDAGLGLLSEHQATELCGHKGGTF